MILCLQCWKDDLLNPCCSQASSLFVQKFFKPDDLEAASTTETTDCVFQIVSIIIVLLLLFVIVVVCYRFCLLSLLFVIVVCYRCCLLSLLFVIVVVCFLCFVPIKSCVDNQKLFTKLPPALTCLTAVVFAVVAMANTSVLFIDSASAVASRLKQPSRAQSRMTKLLNVLQMTSFSCLAACFVS